MWWNVKLWVLFYMGLMMIIDVRRVLVLWSYIRRNYFNGRGDDVIQELLKIFMCYVKPEDLMLG